MDWKKVFEKGWKGIFPAIFGYLIAQIPLLTDWLVGLIPENIAEMTVAGIVAGILNAAANWFKHRK